MVKAFGAIPSAYDPRDYSVRMAAGAATFPPVYTAKDVEIYDQGSIGNCVMQAISSAPVSYTHLDVYKRQAG